jgi:glycosyltransferase involved in cell wall biosynthesis
MKERSVLFLTSGRRAPSSRFRVLQYIDLLRADGWTATVAPCLPDKFASHHDWPGGFLADGVLTAAKVASRLWSALKAPGHEIVYIERELIPYVCPEPEQFVRLLNPSIIFDFDDAVYLNYPAENNPIPHLLKMSEAVIAGNEILGTWAISHTDRVWVLPTPVDTDRYAMREPVGDGRILVWTGSRSNLKYLEAIAPALAATAKLHPGLTLRVVCDRPPTKDLGIPVEFVRWSEEIEVEAVRTADIGLMPLANDEWCLGKCGYKLLQYMSCGLPSVASPWGIVSDMLDAGRCGLPAQDLDEWASNLDLLVRETDYRREIGLSARDHAERIYSLRVMYPRWKEVLESVRDAKMVARV